MATPAPCFTEDPSIYCQACNKVFVAKDAFELGEGSESECRLCGTLLVCEEQEEEVTRTWSWIIKPADPSPEPEVKP